MSTDLLYRDLEQHLKSEKKLNLRQRKNTHKKGLFQNTKDTRQFFDLVRKISKVNRTKGFYTTAKAVITGSTKAEQDVFPSKKQVREYFTDLYANKQTSTASKPPVKNILVPFNDKPVTLDEVKKALKTSNLKSSPGLDKITYRQLFKVTPQLVKLYNSILNQGQPPAASTAWCQSIVTLIHKKGDRTDPANYRPIAVTSVIARLLHRIIATRLQTYIKKNHLINAHIQKGFITGTHGTLEHSHTLNQNLENDCYVTLFDLKNAFGSIEHSLVSDTLSSIKIPGSLFKYLTTLYSQISSKFTGPWGTVNVPFKRGVFQGCPLSPLIFILAIEPLINILNSPVSRPLAYADDAALITTNIHDHYEITRKFNCKANAMSLSIRPDKCISIGVSNGKIVPFKNVVDEQLTSTLSEVGHTSYLGKLICAGGQAEVGQLIYNKFEQRLSNIEKADISNKLKTRIAVDYLLKTSYHDLMTNDLNPDLLQRLDSVFTDKISIWDKQTQLRPNQVPSILYHWLHTLKIYLLIQADDDVMESAMYKYQDTKHLETALAALNEDNPKLFLKRAYFGKCAPLVHDPMPFPVSQKRYDLADVFPETIPEVRTGGCYLGRHDLAGYGVYWGPDNPLNCYGSVFPPTSNRAKLTAVITALSQADELRLPRVKIYTDSTYVITGDITSWKAKNWHKIKNTDLWKRFDGLTKRVQVQLLHVRGITMAAQLARRGAHQ